MGEKDVVPLADDIHRKIWDWVKLYESGNQRALETVSHVAGYALEEIAKLAYKGDKYAAKLFHHVLRIWIDHFDELGRESPEIFETIARETTHWPGIISKLNFVKKRNEKLLSQLNLGADVKDLNLDGNWSLDQIEVNIALQLRGIINHFRIEQLPENVKKAKARYRKNMEEINRLLRRPKNYRPPLAKPIPLPAEMRQKLERENKLRDQSYALSKNLSPLNHENYHQWFKASFPYFKSRYGDDFEDRKCFAGFIPIAQKSAAREGKKIRGVLRRYIKQRILDAFKKIAPEVELKPRI